MTCVNVRKNIARPRMINTLDISYWSTIIDCVNNFVLIIVLQIHEIRICWQQGASTDHTFGDRHQGDS